jgi:hypothetical protein
MAAIMNKLRVGVILPDHKVPAWVRSMLERIRDSSDAAISALAFADQPNSKPASVNKQYDLQLKLHWSAHIIFRIRSSLSIAAGLHDPPNGAESRHRGVPLIAFPGSRGVS